MKYDEKKLLPWNEWFIGFDVEQFIHQLNNNQYPPYNIEILNKDHICITIAIAGFADDEISVELQRPKLFIYGKKNKKDENTFIHKGIANRSFQKKFIILENVDVKGAIFEYGLLKVILKINDLSNDVQHIPVMTINKNNDTNLLK